MISIVVIIVSFQLLSKSQNQLLIIQQIRRIELFKLQLMQNQPVGRPNLQIFQESNQTIPQESDWMIDSEQAKKNIDNANQKWINRTVLLFISILIGFLIFQGISIKEGTNERQCKAISSHQGKAESKFPRIIWVQTDHELEAKHMEEAMVAQNHIHFGKLGGFEVRVVNNLNAYDWLSPEMTAFVKETHQKSKIRLPVYQLLRIALLYEHGGVSIRLPNILLMEGLGWVDDLIRGTEAGQVERTVISCQLQAPQLILYHQIKTDGLWYKDDFIVARPKARLFKVLLEMIEKIVKEGVWPFPKYLNAAFNQNTQVVSFKGMSEALINVLHREDSNLCHNYGLQSFHANDCVFMATIPDSLVSYTIMLSQKVFQDSHGKKYLLNFNIKNIAKEIINIIKTGGSNVGDGNSLLKTKLMMVDGNKWLTTPRRKTRDVQLCIVSLTPLSPQAYEQQIKEQIDRLSKQTFTNWNLVSFVEGLATVSQKAGEMAVLVNASIYEGLNLQRAATKYCDPASVMFLLDHNEKLSTERDLQILADQFKSIGVFVAFVNLKITAKLISPSYAILENVVRVPYKPNKELLSDIGNLMRVFTVELYRFITHVDLRHSRTGRYYDREIPLLSMLEFGQEHPACDWNNEYYQVRRLEEYMNFPREKVFSKIAIHTTRFKTADLTRHEYYAKFRYYRACECIDIYWSLNEPVEQMVVLNDGQEEQGLVARKALPQLIPRKIHQIWVGGEIPTFKQFLMKRLRDSHPNYEYFLWTERNFTRENFPESYDLIQTLLDLDKKSPWSKMAMVADIARYEIVYRHGGFYLDTNFMLFGESPLDNFLTYAFMNVQGMAVRHRVLRDNGIFGATKGHSHLARIVSHRTLSSRNQHSQRAGEQTGPALFGRVQRGKEEQDPTFFQQTLEEFWPNYPYDPESPNYNKCEASNGTLDSQILFRSPKGSYLKNCSAYYEHYAFGMNFAKEGGSWNKRRW